MSDGPRASRIEQNRADTRCMVSEAIARAAPRQMAVALRRIRRRKFLRLARILLPCALAGLLAYVLRTQHITWW